MNDSGNEAELAETTKNVSDSGSGMELIEVTNLSQIDEALNKGPVVLKLGSKGLYSLWRAGRGTSQSFFQCIRILPQFMLIDVKEYPEFAKTLE